MFSFNRSLPPDVIAELERLRKLEASYGPVAKLVDRIDELTEDFMVLCQKYEKISVQISAGGRAVDLVERERELLSSIEQLDAEATANRESLAKEYAALNDMCETTSARLSTYAPITDLANLEQALKSQVAEVDAALSMKRDELKELSALIGTHRDAQELRELGLYEPVFDYESTADYKEAIDRNSAEQKAMVKAGEACICKTKWAVEGNERAGETFVRNIMSIVLRAFNNECEALIGRVNWRNFDKTKSQVEQSFKKINSFVAAKKIELTGPYLVLKLQQLTLVHEHAQKLKQEKEALRRERELDRENQRAEREYQKAIAKAEEEEMRYQSALENARKELGHHDSVQMRDRIHELEAKLERATAERERAKSMAQMTRSGHVYIISNIGSFGERVFKVGMTRRIDPMDRIHELGDASVPFAFDVHAMIWAEDAPGLENALHRRLDQHRVNRINYRKEFFHAELETVRQAAIACAPNSTFIEHADAEQYYASLSYLDKAHAERAS